MSRKSEDPGYSTGPQGERVRGVGGIDFRSVHERLQVRDYLVILAKRKRFIALTLALVVALGWIRINSVVPLYRASATIEIRQIGRQSIKTLGEAVARRWWSMQETYSTQRILLKSRAVALEVVRRLDLARSPEFLHPPMPLIPLGSVISSSLYGSDHGGVTGGKGRSSEDELASVILKGLSVRRIGASGLMRVSMDFWDPVLAKRILESYTQCFLERNLQRRRKSLEDANKWLQEELRNTEDRLVDSLTALIRFTSKHGIVSLDEKRNHLIAFFNRAAENLIDARERRLGLEAILTGKSPPPLGLLPGKVKREDISRLNEKLALMESRYAELSEVYSADYPKMRLLAKQMSVLKRRIGDIGRGLVQAALDTARKREALDRQGFQAAKKAAMDSNSLTVEHAVLKKEVETNERLYKLLLEKSKDIQLTARIVENNLTLVSPPRIPEFPVRPRRARILFVAVILGMALGVSGAFLLEQLDDKIRTTEDVEERTGLHALGIIPDVKMLKHELRWTGPLPARPQGAQEFLPCLAPGSRVSDAVAGIVTSVLLGSSPSSARTVLVSSTVPGEGKTFVTTALAVAMSSTDRRVLVVDTDLRRPAVGEILGAGRSAPGLITLLTSDKLKLSDVIVRSKIPGLHFLPAGGEPTNPPAFLRSERLALAIGLLKKSFDFVLFDSPPVIGFPDAQILAALCDSVILVTKEGTVSSKLMRYAADSISSSGGSILGVVLNMAGVKHSNFSRYEPHNHYNRYGYDRYYAATSERGREPVQPGRARGLLAVTGWPREENHKASSLTDENM